MKRLFSWFAALMICVVAFGDETNWEFSSEYVEINGMRYRLDANNKVAQFLTGDYEMGFTNLSHHRTCRSAEHLQEPAVANIVKEAHKKVS